MLAILLGILVSVATITSAPVDSSRPEPVQVRLVEGDVLRFQVRDVVWSEVEYGPVPVRVDMNLERQLEVRVLQVEPEVGYRIEVVLKHIKAKLESPMGGLEFASDDDKEEYNSVFQDKALQLKQLVGQPVKASLDLDGRVHSVSGYEEIYASSDLGKRLKAMGEVLSNQDYRTEVQALFTLLPEESEEGKLSRHFPITILGNRISFRPTYRSEGAADGTLRWSFRTDDVDAGSRVTEAAADRDEEVPYLENVDVDEGVLQGEATISVEDGVPLRQRIQVAISLQVPSPLGGSKKFPSRASHESTIIREREAAPAKSKERKDQKAR